ncbi:hypothetical protein [Demequina lutea]|uniref:Uncharacterized protein n=1 Tax=Demequina lutea TaxID=431489 RepID=A0A7Y9Z8T6_9MICO|nr:hypothetical protein [Demequina lutea]NYI40932.1 hypothetical protein [Demequina lutea]
MTLDPDVLLAGPRGRGLLVHLFDDVAIRTLRMRADSAAGLGASSMLYMSASVTPGVRGLVDRVRTGRHRVHAEREMRRPVVPAEMAQAIVAAPLPSVSPAALVEALGRTVDDAKPWQPSDGNEAVLASAEVRAALTALAERVAETAFARAWAAPAQPEQWVLDRKDDRLGSEPIPAPAAALAAWREAVEAEERAAVKRREKGQSYGGPWWSNPPGYLTHSTSAWREFGPVGLYLEEDSFGPMAADATPVGAPPEKTYEITGAVAWARLCREYPLDVTATREVLWNHSVGHSDVWVIPDWQAMAADWDAVHLTIAGYLAAATTRIDVSDGRASAIAGWGPDETVWLRDAPAPTSAVVEWRRFQSVGWRMQMTPMEEEA